MRQSRLWFVGARLAVLGELAVVGLAGERPARAAAPAERVHEQQDHDDDHRDRAAATTDEDPRVDRQAAAAEAAATTAAAPVGDLPGVEPCPAPEADHPSSAGEVAGREELDRVLHVDHPR